MRGGNGAGTFLGRTCNDLLRTSRGAVRVTLIRLLEDAPNEQATEALLRDRDAYVRGIATRRLV